MNDHLFNPVSGRYGNLFCQRTRGGKIQIKRLDIDWKSNRTPTDKMVRYRKAFQAAVSGKKFTSRSDMYSSIREAIKKEKEK